MRSMLSAGLVPASSALYAAAPLEGSASGVGGNRQSNQLNVRDFGAVGDGSKDDTDSIQQALSQLSRSNGKATSGSILFPAGIFKVSRPLFYLGSPGEALTLRGEFAGGRQVKDGACLAWAGASAGSMLILNGANETIVEDLNFLGTEGGGLDSCIHVTADNVITTSLTNPVDIGLQRAVPASMKNIAAGMAVGIGGEGAEYEIVYVVEVTPTHFTARFSRPHRAGARLGGSAGSSGFKIRRSAIGLPTGQQSCGVLFGNATAAETMQVSEVACTDCQFIGTGKPGDSFAGVRVVTGGNVKNFRWDNCTFTRSRRGLSIETGSGTFRVMRPIFGNITECDLYHSGPGALFVDGAESESAAPHRFYVNPSTGAVATIVGCSWQCAAPEDDCIMVSGGSLTLVGNEFHNHRTKQSAPRIRVNSLSSGTSQSQLTSIGNWYQNASDEIPRFLDGSGNLFGRSASKGAGLPRFVSLGDSGGNGGPYTPLAQSMGSLAVASAGLSSEGCTAGLSFEKIGQLNTSSNTVTIPFTALQGGGSSIDLVIFRVPPRTRIVGAIADTQVAFAGMGVTMRLGLSPGGDDIILDHDISAVGARGLDDSELGVSVRSTSEAKNAKTIWSAGGLIYARFKTSGRNLAKLDTGRVSIHLIAQHW